MKAIIFDLDNTLILWKNEYVQELFKVLKNYNILDNDGLYIRVDNCIDRYEKCHSELTKELFLEFINSKCNLDLPISFVEDLIIAQGNCFTKDEKLKDVILYLSSKYDLYVITNWFTKTQELRLENLGILKYFKKVWGSDINYTKPRKEAFDCVLNMYQPSECVYVGDSLEMDIKPASSLGMNTMWVTDKKSNEFKTIKNVYELKELL